MTLRDLLLDNWSLFYHPQTWMVDEPFMDRDVPVTGAPMPRGFVPCVAPPVDACPYCGSRYVECQHCAAGFDLQPNVPQATVDDLPDAALLAALYVANPHDPYWVGKYFWTADTDSLGQRVYLGDNGKGLELHRHIHLTDRFGVAVW